MGASEKPPDPSLTISSLHYRWQYPATWLPDKPGSHHALLIHFPKISHSLERPSCVIRKAKTRFIPLATISSLTKIFRQAPEALCTSLRVRTSLWSREKVFPQPNWQETGILFDPQEGSLTCRRHHCTIKLAVFKLVAGQCSSFTTIMWLAQSWETSTGDQDS